MNLSVGRLFLFVLLILICGRLSLFTEPLGISVDESTYLTMAERVSAGGTLYVDAVDRKPPGLIWTYQGIASLFGTWNIHAIHFVFLLLSALISMLAFWVTRRHESALLAAAYSTCLTREVYSANAEILMLLLLALSFLFFVKAMEFERPHFRLIFLASLLGSASILFKQYGGIVYALIYLVGMTIFARKRGPSLTEKIKDQFGALGIAAASVFIILGSVSFYFKSRGALEEFWNWYLLDGLKYIQQDASQFNNQFKVVWIFLGILLAWFPLWILAVRMFRQERNRFLALATGGLVGSFITVVLSGRYYTHYFIPVIWFLVILATMRSLNRRWMMLAFLPYLVFIPLNYARELLPWSWAFDKSKQSAIYELGEWIERHSFPEDRIVVWGMASQIYVASHRGSATRFIFSDFVSGRLPGYKSAASIPIPGSMQIFLREIQENKPKFLIDTSTANINDYGNFPLKRFPPLEELVHSKFSLVDRVAGFDVYKRN